MLPCDGCAILVLGAGRGSRMGGPKALMQVGGRPWWLRQQERLAPLGGRVIWVVSPKVLGELRSRLRSEIAAMSMAVVDDDAPMFASVLEGVRAALQIDVSSSGEQAGEAPIGVFVLPVDVPAPRAETWQALRSGDGASPRVPVCKGERGHPVYLPGEWARRNIVDAARNAAAASSLRLDTLLANERVLVEVNDPDVLTNLNTPENVESWAARSIAI